MAITNHTDETLTADAEELGREFNLLSTFSFAFAGLALILALPDVGALVAGKVSDPVMILASQQASNFYQLMVNFSAAGFFVAYLFPLAGSVICRLRRQWRPSVFDLGGAGTVVSVVALVWCALEFVNIAWPRSTYPQWYLNWSVWLAVGGLALIGAPLFLAARSRMRPLRAFEDDGDEYLTAAGSGGRPAGR